MREGYVNVDGGRVWYKVVGQKGKTPLVVVHGGPGYPHDYLEPLGALGDEREVIFYDQLGCGKSDRPDDAPTQRDGAEDRRDDAGARSGTAEDRRDDIRLWTIDRYVRELQELVRFLNFEEYHMLGQSWGAALAASFALTQPLGLKKLILSDPYLSNISLDEGCSETASVASERGNGSDGATRGNRHNRLSRIQRSKKELLQRICKQAGSA